MEQNTIVQSENNMQDIEVLNKKTNPLIPFLSFTIIFLLLLLGVVSYLLISNQMEAESQNLVESGDSKILTQPNNPNSPSSESPISQITSELTKFRDYIQDSEIKSYALTNQGKIVLVPVEVDSQIEMDSFEVRWGSGASGFGSNEPNTSPDLKKTAYIDTSEKLHLISADGERDVKISQDLLVDYISGWSSDSNKLVFHAVAPTMADLIFPQGPGDQIKETVALAKNNFAEGFYLLDIESEELVYLSMFDDSSFGAWVGDDRILASINLHQPNESYVLFDWNSYVVNKKIMDGGINNDFGSQHVFSADGKKWALTWHGGDGGTNTASIILADFPKVEGKELMTADFAQIQGPVISPDGEKVAFRGYDEVNGPLYVYLYDGQKVERVADGFPRMWVNDSQFLYLLTNPAYASNPNKGEKLFLYDLVTQTSKELYSFE